MSRVLTDEILSVVATATGRQVGDGTAPASPVLPYAVLYPLPSPDHDGDLTSPDRDRGWLYQTTSVGATREQAQWMADQVQDAMEDEAFAPSGVTVMDVETTTRGSVERDDDTGKVTGPGDTASFLFYSVDTYEFWTTR
jgi:hypothetical protein